MTITINVGCNFKVVQTELRDRIRSMNFNGRNNIFNNYFVTSSTIRVYEVVNGSTGITTFVYVYANVSRAT